MIFVNKVHIFLALMEFTRFTQSSSPKVKTNVTKLSNKRFIHSHDHLYIYLKITTCREIVNVMYRLYTHFFIYSNVLDPFVTLKL